MILNSLCTSKIVLVSDMFLQIFLQKDFDLFHNHAYAPLMIEQINFLLLSQSS